MTIETRDLKKHPYDVLIPKGMPKSGAPCVFVN